MKRATYDLAYYVNVARRVFDEQTGEELAELKDHFGGAYDEAKSVALLAVKMFARIAGIENADTSRGFDGLLIERLVDRAIQRM